VKRQASWALWWAKAASGVATFILMSAPVGLGLFGIDAAQAITKYSLMSSSFTPPTQIYHVPIELGVELTTSSDQWVTQVKFYKAAASTEPHVARVWNASGTLLTTQPFGQTTASGWQTVNLSSPVSIRAGSTFTVSVFSDDFYYSDASFPSTSVGPLTVKRGVYKYTNTSAFPDQSVGWNYAVDLTVQSSLPVASTITALPTAGDITYGTPLSGATLTGGTASVPGTFTFTSPSTVLGAGNQTASVTFTPTDSDNYSPTTGTVSVSVAQATPIITAPATAGDITYGTPLSGATLSGGTASVPGTFAFTSPSATPNAGTSNASITFTPTDAANYTTATTTIPITISRATPTISTPPTASNITYGADLSGATLTGGTASVPGAFTFTDPAIVFLAGSQTASVTFTPTDSANYTTASTTVPVTVLGATPTITTPPTASNITYRTPLSEATLSGGTASVPGTFAFTYPATILGAGNQTASVTFTPTDSDNYSPTTGTVSINVARAAPAITTPPTAGNITFGLFLSGATLTGGSASVPGTFAFTTPSAMPALGTSGVSITFTPTDTANYTTATTSISITVLAAVPKPIPFLTQDPEVTDPLSAVSLNDAPPLNPAGDQPDNTAHQYIPAIVFAATAGAAAVAAAVGASARRRRRRH